MVLKRLGPSFVDRVRECGQRFSLDAVTLFAVQLVSQDLLHLRVLIYLFQALLSAKNPFMPLYSL